MRHIRPRDPVALKDSLADASPLLTTSASWATVRLDWHCFLGMHLQQPLAQELARRLSATSIAVFRYAEAEVPLPWGVGRSSQVCSERPWDMYSRWRIVAALNFR